MLLSNWTLASQNREMKRELSVLRARVNATYDIGALLPEASLVDDRGRTASLASRAQAPAVIAFFTTTCPYCEESIPVWKRLAEQADRSGARLAAVSMDPPEATRAWIERWDIPFDVWMPASREDRDRLEPASVPLSLVVRDGRVQMSLAGSLRSREVVGPVSLLLRD